MKKQWGVKFDGRSLGSGEIISTIFDKRGIEDFSHFLNPNEDDLIPLDRLHNIDKAFEIIDEGLIMGYKFLIYADVDCDGATAGAIMIRYLRNFTDKLDWYINEGKEHGVKNFDVSACDADIIIIVDSINEPECYEKFKGKQVIILDHHIVPDNFNANVTLISSANDYPNPQLSGAGVVWKFCKYCDEMFLTDYADNLVDLATCGLIADMMDMTSEENRYICSLGFNNVQNTGIKKINGSYKFDSQAVSFGIAPLVNAANRLNLNTEALKLFISEDEKEVAKTVKNLKSAKEEQNTIVSDLMPSIREQAMLQLDNKVMFFVVDTDAGISGLIANKLIAEYQRPVFVLKKTDKGYAGSGRGYGVEDFKSYVDNTELAWTGGHENAFGTEISDENYIEFQQKINKMLADVEFTDTKLADVELNLEQITDQLIDNFKYINKISGEGFKPLSIIIRNITDYDVGYMSGGKHLKISVGDVVIIKWNFNGSFEEFDGRPFSIIGGLTSGYFGRTYYKQIIIDDYMFEGGE